MVLSVVVYNHKLTVGQWFGAAIVFAGIGVEAWVKRKGTGYIAQFRLTFVHLCLSIEVHAKRVLQEKEKAKIKSL